MPKDRNEEASRLTRKGECQGTKLQEQHPTDSWCQTHSNTEAKWCLSPMACCSPQGLSEWEFILRERLISEDGAWLQVALGTQQWTEGNLTIDYKDRLTSDVPSQLLLHHSREQERIALVLTCKWWTDYRRMRWLVLARGFGYPISGNDSQRLRPWDALDSKSHGNLHREPLCCWKTTPTPSQA